jgi:hypothetical protein
LPAARPAIETFKPTFAGVVNGTGETLNHPDEVAAALNRTGVELLLAAATSITAVCRISPGWPMIVRLEGFTAKVPPPEPVPTVKNTFIVAPSDPATTVTWPK